MSTISANGMSGNYNSFMQSQAVKNTSGRNASESAAKKNTYTTKVPTAIIDGAAAYEAETENEFAAKAVDPVQFIHDRIDEMRLKLQNGDIEQKFMIGSTALTQKEWEDMLEGFDSQEEALRQLMAQEAARKQAEDARVELLFCDTVLSRFHTGLVDDNGVEIEDIYITAVDEESIRCCKPGQKDNLWEIKLDDEQQYEKANEFLGWASGYMDNFLFAANESFWKDLLNGEMDEGAFRDFLANSTKDGKPIYTYGDENNMYIDTEKAQWAKYMNRPGSFVAIKDIEAHIRNSVADKQKKLAVLPNPLP